MAAGKIFVAAAIWVAVMALAVNAQSYWELAPEPVPNPIKFLFPAAGYFGPAPSPSDATASAPAPPPSAATGGMASVETMFIGLVMGAVSFLTLKNFI